MQTDTKTCAHPAFERIETLAQIITSYRTDFTDHDVAHLQELAPSVPFIWCARSNGSHLYSRTSVESGKAAGWNNYAECARACAQMESTWTGWYSWDGCRLSKVSVDTAAALLDRWYAAAPDETEKDRDARLRRGGW
jgi:hypothetical protein